MESPYQVFEPSETVEGEFVLLQEFDKLSDAESFAETRSNTVIEQKDGNTSRIIESD